VRALRFYAVGAVLRAHRPSKHCPPVLLFSID
jgi:hypothetical protein